MQALENLPILKESDPRVLQSIIEITAQRDTDALERRFLSVLAEMLPINRASICKALEKKEALEVEASLSLCASSNPAEPLKRVLECFEGPSVLSMSPQMEACLLSQEACRKVLEDGSWRLLIPVVLRGETQGFVMLHSGRDLTAHLPLLEGLVRVYENYLGLLCESEYDTLTQLFSRRTFDKKLKRLLRLQREARKQGVSSEKYPSKRRLEPDASAWLAILDIDHFKRVNDTYGHVYGDEVLLSFSQKLKASFRSSDLLFRFGGEEFVVILEPITGTNAANTFERFRKIIASHPFPLVGHVTVSIGFARITEDDYPPTILEYADKALYYAKEHGRNRLCSYESLVAQGALAAEDQSGSVELF